MIKRIILLLVWFIAFGAAYLLKGSLICAAAVILGLVYLIASGVLVRAIGRRIACSVEGGGIAEKGTEIPFNVTVRNEGLLPVSRLSLSVEAVNKITGEQQEIPVTCSLRPRGKTTEQFTIADEFCGKEQVQVKKAVSSDSLGIWHRTIPVQAESSGVVMPHIEKIDIPGGYLDAYDMESYVYSQHQAGSDLGQTFGVREYKEGDSPRQIHWKLSAKMDELQVKIPSYPIENNLIVLLDTAIIPDREDSEYAQSQSVSSTPEIRSRLLDLYSSVSHSLILLGVVHSLGWYDSDKNIFESKRIRTEQDLHDALPDILGAAFTQDGISTIYRYLELAEDHEYSNHFVVTAGEIVDAELLTPYGSVRILHL